MNDDRCSWCGDVEIEDVAWIQAHRYPPHIDPERLNIYPGCSCTGNCGAQEGCECLQQSVEGMTFECNPNCMCQRIGTSSHCTRREAQQWIERDSPTAMVVATDTSVGDGATAGIAEDHRPPISAETRRGQERGQSPLVVRECKGKGKGVYAVRTIPAGNVLGVYLGEIISLAEAHRRFALQLQHAQPKGQATNAATTDRRGDVRRYHGNYIAIIREHLAQGEKIVTTCVDPRFYGNISRYFNHSCEPNLACAVVRWNLVPHLVFRAAREIAAGEEVTFDYGRMGDSHDSSSTTTTTSSASTYSTASNHQSQQQSSSDCNSDSDANPPKRPHVVAGLERSNDAARARKSKETTGSSSSVPPPSPPLLSQNRPSITPCKCGAPNCRKFLPISSLLSSSSSSS